MTTIMIVDVTEQEPYVLIISQMRSFFLHDDYRWVCLLLLNLGTLEGPKTWNVITSHKLTLCNLATSSISLYSNPYSSAHCPFSRASCWLAGD